MTGQHCKFIIIFRLLKNSLVASLFIAYFYTNVDQFVTYLFVLYMFFVCVLGASWQFESSGTNLSMFFVCVLGATRQFESSRTNLSMLFVCVLGANRQFESSGTNLSMFFVCVF